MATFAYTIKLPAVLEDIATAKAKAKGAEVMVEGLVTGIIGNNAFIQDEVAGIYLYNGAKNVPELVVGNKVRVWGILDEFNNLKQIKDVKIEELVSENNVVSSEIITLDKIGEEYESKLVTIEQLEITVVPPAVENNYSIKATDGTKTIDLRIDTFVDPKIPSSNYKIGDKVNVTANVGQYKTDYQLMIRTINDIGKAYEGEDTTAPVIVHIPVTEVHLTKDLEIKATVTDDRTVQYVKLYHRVKGTTEYTESYMTKEGDIYSKTILSKDLKLEGIEYYIEASDGKNMPTSPAKKENPYKVLVLDIDIIPPVFANAQPKDGAVLDKASTKPTIKVEYSDLSGINIESVQILVDGIDRTKEAIVTATSVEYTPTEDLKLGRHAVVVKAKDTAGNETIETWFFDIGQKSYSPDGETGTSSQWIITASTNFTQPIPATGGDFKVESGLSCTSPEINFSSGGANTTKWDNGANAKHWLVKTSTKGMANLSLTWRMRSSGSGPSDFKVQYSTDNKSWTDIPNPTIKSSLR